MPKLPPIEPRRLKKVLLKLGFYSKEGKGSHRVFKHPDGRRTVLPIHNQPLRMGTLRAILKQIELTVEEFLKLL